MKKCQELLNFTGKQLKKDEKSHVRCMDPIISQNVLVLLQIEVEVGFLLNINHFQFQKPVRVKGTMFPRK